MKFSQNGTFLFQWGTKGSGPGQFDLPHDVAIATSGHQYGADRNARIQIFEATGRYLTEWKGEQLGASLCPLQETIQHLSQTAVTNRVTRLTAAFIVRPADGSTSARFGRFGNYDGQCEMAHSVAVGPEVTNLRRSFKTARTYDVKAASERTH